MGVGKAIGLGVLAGFVVWFLTPWALTPDWILMINGILFLTGLALFVVALGSRIIPEGTGEMMTLAVATLFFQLASWIFLDPLDFKEGGGTIALLLSGPLPWAFLGPVVLREEHAIGAAGLLGTTFASTSVLFLDSYLGELWMLPLLVLFVVQSIGWIRTRSPARSTGTGRPRRRVWKAGYKAGYKDGHRDGGSDRRPSRRVVDPWRKR